MGWGVRGFSGQVIYGVGCVNLWGRVLWASDLWGGVCGGGFSGQVIYGVGCARVLWASDLWGGCVDLWGRVGSLGK